MTPDLDVSKQFTMLLM